MHRNTDGASLVGNAAGDSLANPPGGVGREFVAPAVFKLVDGFHQADIAFLNQIKKLQAAVGVLFGDRNDQAQVGLNHFFFGITRVGLAFVHALVDVFQVQQRHDHAGLQFTQFGLQFLNRWNVARHDDRPRLVTGNLLFNPFQVQQVGWEILNEGFLRHAAFFNNDAAQFALFFAHVQHLAAQQVAELFNRFGGKAHRHQLFAQGGLGFGVGGRAVAFLVVGFVNLLKEHSDFVEAGERFFFQLFELFRQCFRAAFAVVVVFFVELVKVLFGHVIVGFVGDGETIHHS